MKKLFTISILIIFAIIAYFSLTDKKVSESRSSTSKSDIVDCPGCNLVVILVDTLRADRLPFYGYKTNTSPFLNSLSENSIVFERAFSSSSWTAPATASVFTSVLPSRHGVITGFAATKSQKNRNPSFQLNRIAADLETLPEYLNKSGFQTIGVADNLNIGKEIGFDRGFDKFHKYRYQGAEAVNQKAMEFLDQEQNKNPYFLYLHYMDPHEPYSKKGDSYKPCFEDLKKNKTKKRNKKERIACAYDSEINFVDKHIESLFKKYNWHKNTVVLFISDHGEEFHDHGQDGHGKTLYTEMIHVPFLLYHPRWKGQRVKENVHTLDVMPTIAGLTSDSLKPQWVGKNLLNVIARENDNNSRPIISERLRSKDSRFNWSIKSIVLDNFHLIKTITRISEFDTENKFELYNILNDYSEQIDLAESDPQTTEKLAAMLSNDITEEPETDTVEINADPELLKELKSLGYLE